MERSRSPDLCGNYCEGEKLLYFICSTGWNGVNDAWGSGGSISRQSEDVFEQSTDVGINIVSNSYVYDMCRLKLGK